MNLKGFFVTALQAALEHGVATPEDILRHVTSEVLAEHLPRPLWARLLTACVGAPRVDAQLVIETIGVANLCEHAPAPVIWACVADIAARSLGGAGDVAAPASLLASASGPVRGRPLTAPPPDVVTPARPPTPPPALGPSIPAPALGDVVVELDAEDRGASTPPSRSRVPTQQRFRQSNTGIGRLASARRPQAQATPAPAEPPPRPGSEPEETETVVGSRDDWRGALAVDDEQLVEWSAAEPTPSGGERKR